MRIRLSLSLDITRERKGDTPEFEHRDMDTAIEAVTPQPSVIRTGFTVDPDETM